MEQVDILESKVQILIIFKRVVVRDEDWSRALSIAKENGFEKKKNTTKIDRTYVWAARITLVIFLVIILSGIFFFYGICSDKKVGEKPTFLLCGWGDTFCVATFI